MGEKCGVSLFWSLPRIVVPYAAFEELYSSLNGEEETASPRPRSLAEYRKDIALDTRKRDFRSA